MQEEIYGNDLVKEVKEALEQVLVRQGISKKVFDAVCSVSERWFKEDENEEEELEYEKHYSRIEKLNF